MIYVILGGRLGKDDDRILDYELAVGDPVNIVVRLFRGAPVYEQRIVKSLTVENGTIRTEVSAGKCYCPFCDAWDEHDVLECSVWANELSEHERRWMVLRLSWESMKAKWTRAEWVMAMQRATKEVS